MTESMTRRFARALATLAWIVGASAGGAQDVRVGPRSIEDAAFLQDRERLGGLSHASGARPEFGPLARVASLADLQPLIRVGLTPTAFTTTGGVASEYDTAAAHNHAFVEVTSTAGFRALDAQGGAILESIGRTVRFTSASGTIGLDVDGRRIATVGSPVRIEPLAPESLIVVASMRRANRQTPNGALTAPAYRGAIEIRASETDPSRVRVVNELAIEDYVAGVVVNESLSTFHVEALKAQAVAARGYALANRGRFASRGFDVDDSTLSQVYRGQTSETPAAVDATAGTAALVATRDGAIIQALYSSSMGGHTENNEFVFASGGYPGTNADPALRAIHDSRGALEEDLSDEPGVLAFYGRVDPESAEVHPTTGLPMTSLHRWTRGRTADELLARLKDTSRGWAVPATARNIREMTTTIRGASGRAMQIAVSGDGWRTTISGWSEIRALATLAGQTPGGTTAASAPNSPSAFVIARAADGSIATVTFVGGGFGHNVGMSQYGAQGRALRGESFEQILRGYYAGIELAPAFSGEALGRALGSFSTRTGPKRD